MTPNPVTDVYGREKSVPPVRYGKLRVRNHALGHLAKGAPLPFDAGQLPVTVRGGTLNRYSPFEAYRTEVVTQEDRVVVNPEDFDRKPETTDLAEESLEMNVRFVLST